jgi:phosphate transport system permease protein
MVSPHRIRQNRGREGNFSAAPGRSYAVFLKSIIVLVVTIFAMYFLSIITGSLQGWSEVGSKFFTSANWDFAQGSSSFGALALITGTLVTTMVALCFAVPVGLGAALAVVYLIPRRLRVPISSLIELLAVVPSIIYGVWGSLVMAHFLSFHAEPFLAKLTSGGFPFGGIAAGYGLLLGSTVLSVMILPTVTAISRDVFAMVPGDLIEGALSLGATKSQVIRTVIWPASKEGVTGAVALGAGRALGETVAMVFLLGGVNQAHPLPSSLFSTGATLASTIAQNFGEVIGQSSLTSVLCCVALTLMVIVGLVNVLAQRIIQQSQRKFS